VHSGHRQSAQLKKTVTFPDLPLTPPTPVTSGSSMSSRLSDLSSIEVRSARVIVRVFLQFLLVLLVNFCSFQCILMLGNLFCLSTITSHCAQLESVNFWRYRGGFWRQPVDILGEGPRRQTTETLLRDLFCQALQL